MTAAAFGILGGYPGGERFAVAVGWGEFFVWNALAVLGGVALAAGRTWARGLVMVLVLAQLGFTIASIVVTQEAWESDIAAFLDRVTLGGSILLMPDMALGAFVIWAIWSTRHAVAVADGMLTATERPATATDVNRTLAAAAVLAGIGFAGLMPGLVLAPPQPPDGSAVWLAFHLPSVVVGLGAAWAVTRCRRWTLWAVPLAAIAASVWLMAVSLIGLGWTDRLPLAGVIACVGAGIGGALGEWAGGRRRAIVGVAIGALIAGGVGLVQWSLQASEDELGLDVEEGWLLAGLLLAATITAIASITAGRAALVGGEPKATA